MFWYVLVCLGESVAIQKTLKGKAFVFLFFFYLRQTTLKQVPCLALHRHTHTKCFAPVLVVILLPVSAERPAVYFVMPPLQQHPQTFGPSLHGIHPLLFHDPLNRTVQGH